MKTQPAQQSAPLPALARKVASKPVALILVSAVALTPVFSYLFSSLFSSGENMTPAQEQARIEAFQAAIPLSLPTVNLNDPKERQEAFQSMQLDTKQADQMSNDLNSQPGSRLVWVDVFDDYDEDGDVVAVKSLSFYQQTTIFHAPHRMAVYVTPSERQISLIGVRDGGGGGITVAIRVNGGAIPLPRMLPGQVIPIPIM